ncbi:unnamed protein product, partial [Acanthocheilonema viteae]
CEKCNDTVESRNVTCEDINGRAYPLEKCLNENSTEIPIDVRPCSSPQKIIKIEKIFVVNLELDWFELISLLGDWFVG